MKAQIKLPSEIENICKKLASAGFEVAVVGGSVRDLLSGKETHDFDLTTSARPEQILKIFTGAFYNNQFGTVGVPSGDIIAEVTTYTSEEGYSDRRHPDKVVWGKTLEDDLKRRDFTINAMALRYAPFGPSTSLGTQGKQGKLDLVDPYDGQADLKAKVIRAVGDANERFGEDALRILRAIRFATTLGFEIEKKTLESIKKNAKLIDKISGERVRDELFKMVDDNKSDEGFFLAYETGIL